ncbi:hypothetical protein AVEN_44122-1 [Araneus ventricosus]|uniref:Uncharacterized protein n=1 Tax=Araneus ventricosus TaxID=182803 RepID=A0A4Y2DEA3_ARAVE|nr:hypothetical protein AVEN_44122-1 [Araneus ventricosus]
MDNPTYNTSASLGQSSYFSAARMPSGPENKTARKRSRRKRGRFQEKVFHCSWEVNRKLIKRLVCHGTTLPKKRSLGRKAVQKKRRENLTQN